MKDNLALNQTTADLTTPPPMGDGEREACRCGLCLYFCPQKDEPDFGDCLWAGPVPVWVSDADRHDGMMATDGKGCRTYSAKVTA